MERVPPVRLARWSGRLGSRHAPGTVARDAPWDGVPSGGTPVSSVWWGGAEPAVGAAGQLPAALMDGPVVASAEEGEIRQVGGAAVDPMVEMMGVAPGQRPITAREHTTPVTHGQGGPLGWLDDPGGPPHLQGLAGRATQGRGQQGHGRPQPPLKSWHRPAGAAGALVATAVQAGGPGVVAASVVGGRVMVGEGAVAGIRLSAGRGLVAGPAATRTRVTVPSQASRRQASGSSGPAQPRSPPTAPERPNRLSRSTVTSSCGRTPPAWGSHPPSKDRRHSSARASAVR